MNAAQVRENVLGKTFVEYKVFDNKLVQCFYYIYFYHFWLPVFIKKQGIKRYLVFGNYLHGLAFCKKAVLIHHPYLFDLSAIFKLKNNLMIKELARYISFRVLLLLNLNAMLIVQTSSMSIRLKNSILRRFKSKIIPNPFTGSLQARIKSETALYPIRSKRLLENQILKIAYITRYYPHKRFDLLLDFIVEFRKKNIPFVMYVTVDNVQGGGIFFNDYPEIVNWGELPQEELQTIYEDVDLCVYFSDRETFGNTILESLKFGVPIFGLDHDYFRDFVSRPNSALISNSTADMADSICHVVQNIKLFNDLCQESLEYSLPFKSVKNWVDELSKF